MSFNFGWNVPGIRTFRVSLLFFTLLILSKITAGQSCEKIMAKSSSFNAGKEYRPYSIFRAAFVNLNAPIVCYAYFLPEKNYLIYVRSNSKHKPLKFRLVEKNTNNVLFDNSAENYVQETSFSVSDNPINIAIEITILSKDIMSDTSEREEDCAAFWIFMKKKSE